MSYQGIAYHNADPYFTVYSIPNWRARLYQFLSVDIWGNLPSAIQRRISAVYARNYNKAYTKWIIKPYVKYYYSDENYLKGFVPPEGKTEFESFQDFFIRRFRNLPTNNEASVWPCEGLLCDENRVGAMTTSRVKCDVRTVHTIFGVSENVIPDNYTFTNVFLHNKNYHRIHAPVRGKISRIQHIPGDLVVLRPWIYKQDPSLPAFRNERYNIDITDENGQTWFMSIVGGPAVGTIALSEHIQVGNSVDKLDEVALFYLGSTCCMAAPVAPRNHKKNSFVEVGATY